MAVVLIEAEELKRMIREAVAAEVKVVKHGADLPPFLNRKDFMELLGIGESKTAELFKRSGFPVTWEFGNPRVITHLLLQWAEQNSEWVDKHAGEGWKRRSKAV